MRAGGIVPAAMDVPALEHWQADAADAPGTVLTIPPDAKRERVFEIAITVVVGVPADAKAPWLQVTVQANGAQQWQRRVHAHNPGQHDGLDYRFRRSVPVAQTLRLQVAVGVGGGARRRALKIEADEVG